MRDAPHHRLELVTGASLLPRLVNLGPGVVGAAFQLMKLLPAEHMLSAAAAEGRLRPGGQVVETTSGTLGLALAMVCLERGYRLTVVSDPVLDERLQRRLRGLGAEVTVCPQPAKHGGFQQARLDAVAAILADQEDAVWPDQYNNPDNPASYIRVAEHVLDRIGPVDAVVGTVGSGGSMCGTVTALRQVLPEVQAIGVDTQGSVLFGMGDTPRLLRGLGNSLQPGNVRHDVFDEVHWMDAGTACAATRTLHSRFGLFMGSTSGAAYAVAAWWGDRNPTKRVLALLPDEGHRYMDTVYSDAWLESQGIARDREHAMPTEVGAPAQAATADWAWMSWNRRSLREVLQ